MTDALDRLFNNALKAHHAGKIDINKSYRILGKILHIEKKLKQQQIELKTELIKKSFREAAGHSVVNFFRTIGVTEGLTYIDILEDCSGELGLEIDSPRADKFEREIAQAFFTEIWNSLDYKQRKKLLGKIKKEAENLNIIDQIDIQGILTGAVPITALFLAGQAGFGFYIASVTSLSAVSSALGISLGFGAYSTFVSGISTILGPAGIIIAGIWATYKIGSPNYQKKIIPCVLVFAFIRSEMQIKQ